MIIIISFDGDPCTIYSYSSNTDVYSWHGQYPVGISCWKVNEKIYFVLKRFTIIFTDKYIHKLRKHAVYQRHQWFDQEFHDHKVELSFLRVTYSKVLHIDKEFFI